MSVASASYNLGDRQPNRCLHVMAMAQSGCRNILGACATSASLPRVRPIASRCPHSNISCDN